MPLKHHFVKPLSLSATALLFAACGGTVPDAETDDPTQQQEAALLAACEDSPENEEVVEHACVHGDSGPFQSIQASPLGTFPLVNVDAPHTAFDITLPRLANGTWGGAVNFRAPETGEFAFLLSRHRGLRIFDGATEVTRECRADIDEAVCSSLRTMIHAELEEGVLYRLEFRALRQRNASFTLVVEEASHDHAEAP
ncbi:hypothetical protein P2318_03120 [Myxococcaceae bacterium GXIMD 01537]